MNWVDERIDETVLKPAHWQAEDYLKAKTHFKTLIKDVLEYVKPEPAWKSKNPHLAEAFKDGHDYAVDEMEIKAKELKL